MQEDLHCSHCVVGCGYHQAMTHNSGQFWLVPKALEEQAFVILATKPETGLAYPLDVKDWKYKDTLANSQSKLYVLPKVFVKQQ